MPQEFTTSSGKDNAKNYKAQLGIYMFFIYAIFYAGFVVINVTAPLLMERIIFAGLNLAIVYGLSLIVVALLLAVIYNILCTRKESSLNDSSQEKGGR